MVDAIQQPDFYAFCAGPHPYTVNGPAGQHLTTPDPTHEPPHHDDCQRHASTDALSVLWHVVVRCRRERERSMASGIRCCYLPLCAATSTQTVSPPSRGAIRAIYSLTKRYGEAGASAHM